MNTQHIATNIGNAVYTGMPYSIPPMSNNDFREVLRELRKHGVGLNDVMKVEGVKP